MKEGLPAYVLSGLRIATVATLRIRGQHPESGGWQVTTAGCVGGLTREAVGVSVAGRVDPRISPDQSGKSNRETFREPGTSSSAEWETHPSLESLWAGRAGSHWVLDSAAGHSQDMVRHAT